MDLRGLVERHYSKIGRIFLESTCPDTCEDNVRLHNPKCVAASNVNVGLLPVAPKDLDSVSRIVHLGRIQQFGNHCNTPFISGYAGNIA